MRMNVPVLGTPNEEPAHVLTMGLDKPSVILSQRLEAPLITPLLRCLQGTKLISPARPLSRLPSTTK